MSNPCVILFGDGPAARLLLQKTAEQLAAFPDIRVEVVNKSAPPVSKGGPTIPKTPFVGILATSRSGEIADLMARIEPNPLLIIPVAAKPTEGLRLLQAAAMAGAPTVALGEAGARNAALLAVSMFAANGVETLRKALDEFRARQTSSVLKTRLPAV